MSEDRAEHLCSMDWQLSLEWLGGTHGVSAGAVPWIWPLWFIHFLAVGKSTWLIWKQECCASVATSLCAAPSRVHFSSAVFPGCGCGAQLQRDARGAPAARPGAAARPGPDHQGELAQPWGLPKNPAVTMRSVCALWGKPRACGWIHTGIRC